jgi:predicted RNase H-like nuclease (RuvC/YqgF family)
VIKDMANEDKGLEERLSRLKRLFEESKDKAIYYQRIAEEIGKSRLREIDQLSKLIIENKHTIEALARSEKLLKDSFNAIPDLFTVQDISLRVLISNWHGYILLSGVHES